MTERAEFSLSDLRGSDRKLVELRRADSRAGRLARFFDAQPFRREDARQLAKARMLTLARTKAEKFLAAYDGGLDVDNASGVLKPWPHERAHNGGNPPRVPDDVEEAFEHVETWGPATLDRTITSKDGVLMFEEWLFLRDAFDKFAALRGELHDARKKIADLEHDLKAAKDARDELQSKLEDIDEESIAIEACDLCASLVVYLGFEGVDTPPEQRALHAKARNVWSLASDLVGGAGSDPSQAALFTREQLKNSIG